jgi:hypothetical protein
MKNNKKKQNLKEHALGVVGVGAINNIFERPKTDYELAFEHFLGGKYEVNENKPDLNKDFNSKVNTGNFASKPKSGKKNTLTPPKPLKESHFVMELENYLSGLVDQAEEYEYEDIADILLGYHNMFLRMVSDDGNID